MNRLLKELKEIEKSKEKDLSLKPISDSDMYAWVAKFEGPSDTPYEKGIFEIKLSITNEYPIRPPKAEFITKVFHPNTGEICLDILKTSWSPAWTLSTVCRAIMALLSHPDADSPLNCDAGNLIRNGDKRGYASMASMYTKMFATSEKLKHF